MPNRLAFEDFVPGQTRAFGQWLVTRESILRFAQAFDPQPFHLDEAAGAASLLGGLAASGWHSAGILMRLTCDGWLNQALSLGGSGVDDLRWLQPVRPGDVLGARHTIIAARASQSRPEMGLVTQEAELLNQDGVVVVRQTNTIMIGRRGMAPRPLPPPATAAQVTAPAAEPVSGWYEDATLGLTLHLGAVDFSEAAIIEFAQEFDPQPFHIDAEAARASQFGGLIASGWHTAAGFMRCYVNARQGGTAAAGPAPGVRDLRWPRPVRPGDRISYATQAQSRRPTSRKGWGLLDMRNSGVNQRGETVLEFTATVLCPMREAPGAVGSHEPPY